MDFVLSPALSHCSYLPRSFFLFFTPIAHTVIAPFRPSLLFYSFFPSYIPDPTWSFFVIYSGGEGRGGIKRNNGMRLTEITTCYGIIDLSTGVSRFLQRNNDLFSTGIME